MCNTENLKDKNTNHRQNPSDPHSGCSALLATRGVHKLHSRNVESYYQRAIEAATSNGSHRANCLCSESCRNKEGKKVLFTFQSKFLQALKADWVPMHFSCQNNV